MGLAGVSWVGFRVFLGVTLGVNGLGLGVLGRVYDHPCHCSTLYPPALCTHTHTHRATRVHTGAAPQAGEGGRDPPPPSQEDAQTVARRCTAWQSRVKGDINPQPQRFWLRRGPLPRPEQAPETGAQADRTAPLVL